MSDKPEIMYQRSIAHAASIEQGYFIFTLMPSLRCSLNCPHCYLSLKQRRESPYMHPEQITLACIKVDEYYKLKMLPNKTIICYWYGGEPLQYEKAYMLELLERIGTVFTKEKGYNLSHTFLSSLITMDETWYPHLMHYGNGYIQTSFDGAMRGKNYVTKWESKVKQLTSHGFKVGTISVVNSTMITAGPKSILEYLSELGIIEASFLPFMLNEQNFGGKYNKYAPTMSDYSDFMIELTKEYINRKKIGELVPELGQMRFILGQSMKGGVSNIAGQTLFLMPNGDFVLPDYKDGFLEFMQPFGNILTSSFSDVLESEARRKYLRRQFLKNNNTECIGCEHTNKCLMEFWKPNREGDDCFGAQRYVNWLTRNRENIPLFNQTETLY